MKEEKLIVYVRAPEPLSLPPKKCYKKSVVVHSQEKILINGKKGLEKIYLYKGKYYTLGAIGTNGYIVSMYPIDGGK